MELTSKNVHAVVMDCLFTDEEIAGKTTEQILSDPNCVSVEGVVRRLGFNKIRLDKHVDDIVSMLGQLPLEFGATTGGGWSFLNACVRRDGDQWGEHRDVDALLCLGMAIDRVAILMPRDMWSVLPGGMPYFAIKPE